MHGCPIFFLAQRSRFATLLYISGESHLPFVMEPVVSHPFFWDRSRTPNFNRSEEDLFAVQEIVDSNGTLGRRIAAAFSNFPAFLRPEVGPKEGAGWMPVDGSSGASRATTLLVLDVEPPTYHVLVPPAFDVVLSRVRSLGLSCVAHTTYNHQATYPRYRLIFGLSRPTPHQDLLPVANRIVDSLQLKLFVDFGRHTQDRFWYTPRYPAEREADFRVEVLEGHLIDIDLDDPQRSGFDHQVTLGSALNEGSDQNYEAPRSEWIPDGFPDGYRLTKEGIEEQTKNGFVRICGPIVVYARTRSDQDHWGLLLWFVDFAGNKQKLAIVQSSLLGNGLNLAAKLADQGFDVVPGKAAVLKHYIAAWKPHKTVRMVKRLGWAEDTSGQLIYVLPEGIIGGTGSDEVMYQPESNLSTLGTIKPSGTLEDWKLNVANKACDHPWLLFALCVGFAVLLLRFGGVGDSFLVHFWGLSSRGKSTLLQVVASLFGFGGDPTDREYTEGFIRNWNLTPNAFEGLAEAHSDLLFLLDELRTASVDNIEEIIHMLSGGEGKAAMNAQRNMRKRRVWRTIAVSTGEISVHEKVSNPNGNMRRTRAVKAGVTHRALDLEVDDIVGNLPEELRKGFVDELKQNCGRFYGTAGPEFIRATIDRFGTVDKVSAYVNERVTEFLTEIAPSGLAPEYRRALQRFALFAVGGEFAVEVGLLPQRAIVRETVGQFALKWLASTVTLDRKKQILDSIRSYILKKQAHFEDVHAKVPLSGRVGWRDVQNDRWLFADEQLFQAVPETTVVEIVEALRSRVLLFSNDSARVKTKYVISSLPGRLRVYAIKGSILGDDVINDEATGQAGHPGQAGQAGPDHAQQGADPIQEAS